MPTDTAMPAGQDQPTSTAPAQGSDMRRLRAGPGQFAPMSRQSSFLPLKMKVVDEAGQAQEWDSWRIRFTGQGGEYFKLWMVNLLLTVATLGLYYPWARLRKLRYLANATQLDGHSLQFHGKPWPLLRGYLLLGALAFAVNVAVQISRPAALVAIGTMVLLTPALWRTALRFRLANTSWRGVRFQFTGSWAGAYLPFLVVSGPAWAFAAVLATASRHAPAHDNFETLLIQTGLGSFMGICIALTVLLVPAGMFLLKRYQHSHYRFGQWQTQYKGTLASFYKPFGMLLIGACALFILFFLRDVLARSSSTGLVLSSTLIALVSVLAMLVYYISVVPYLKVAQFKAAWGPTLTPDQRVNCNLQVLSFVLLTLKNNLLTGITMGLYWPVAQMNFLQAKVESLRIASRVPLSEAVAQMQAQDIESSGEAAVDLFGIDFGL
ncbi:MAG: DUF898 domain-containing protein [Burkholderiaceae bacterium]|nr:MAG: DUF898 domain-containing protein [Burkholderiaceae bacterium]